MNEGTAARRQCQQTAPRTCRCRQRQAPRCLCVGNVEALPLPTDTDAALPSNRQCRTCQVRTSATTPSTALRLGAAYGPTGPRSNAELRDCRGIEVGRARALGSAGGQSRELGCLCPEPSAMLVHPSVQDGWSAPPEGVDGRAGRRLSARAIAPSKRSAAQWGPAKCAEVDASGRKAWGSRRRAIGHERAD